jgi:excisionase family DNA binding protein
MPDLMSVTEAARSLNRDPSRVRALVGSGRLPGIRIGNHWAVDRLAVEQRKRAHPQAGRPFEPHNAWALLLLAAGREVRWLDASSLWRLRSALSHHGLRRLSPRLRRRAAMHRFRAHPGELSRLIKDRALVRSGISAAGQHGLGLVSGSEVDGYVPVSELAQLKRKYALEPRDRGDANVILRAVPDHAWHLDEADRVAPLPVVALDLAEDPDPRSARAGGQALSKLDRKLKRRAR